MELVAGGLAGVLGLINLVCWIMVLIKMFQAGYTTPAILSIVLICCGIGPLVALIFGWLHADAIGARTILTVWTVCLLLQILALTGTGLIQTQIGL